ncbi:MAG TPA: diguanylate cyclase [candidate division Zixibacteria bacterium]|nr:diguanylate cyclase [candidate division Zixibacteria bacterium]
MLDAPREILDRLESGVIVIGSDKRIDYCNDSALKILDISQCEKDRLCYEFIMNGGVPCTACIQGEAAGHSRIIEIKSRDSDRFIEIIQTKLESGKILAQLRDVTAYKILQDELDRSLITEAESGLIKRNYIYDNLQREMSRARRFGRNVGLIMLKISDLAQPGVNTAPKIVARILRGIGEILGNDLRAYDLAFRYDKDIFAVILPGENLDGAMCVANRLYAKIKNLGIQRARIGVAIMGSATSPEMVIEAATRALYVAEHSDDPIATI